MAKLDYAKLQDRVSKLMPKVAQGTVTLKRVTTADPNPQTPWEPGTETTETWPLDAVVKRVDQRYENGVLIVATVDIVTFAVPTIPASVEPEIPANTPALTDTLVIDGRERAITSLKPTPSAGTVVAWRAVVAV